MKQTDQKEQLPMPPERVKLVKPVGRRLFFLFSFFVCVAVLIAAFAVSGIWSSFSAPVQTFFDGIFHRDRIANKESGEADLTPAPASDSGPETEPPSETPQNAVPILAKTLVEPEKTNADAGEEAAPVRLEGAPFVFIYCSNPKEAYLSGDETGEINELSFSEDASKTVCAVAKKLLNTLSENGISAVYREPETKDGYLGSSARAKALLQSAVSEYPQISLVIEISRDSLIDSEGNYIKTVTKDPEKLMAQVLAVVGSGESGIPCPAFQENLRLAETLQGEAEKEIAGIFRGIRVKSTPQNQQYAPCSLSLVIGSGGNSIEEAEQTAEQIGKILSRIFD